METGDPVFPVMLSLRIATIAMLVVTPPALAIAWFQANYRYPGRSLVESIVLLPLVLPPSVVGFFLVVLMGRRGTVGAWLEEAFGIQLVFTPTAAIITSPRHRPNIAATRPDNTMTNNGNRLAKRPDRKLPKANPPVIAPMAIPIWVVLRPNTLAPTSAAPVI